MSSLITTAKFRRLVHFLILIRVKFLKDLGAVHTWCVGTSVWVLPQNGGVSSQFEYPISDYVHPAGFLKTLSPNGSFASNNFFGQKLSKVANIKTKSATIAFFLFSSFPSARSFFFSFPLLMWFWSFSCLRNQPCDAFSLKFREVGFQKIG